MRNKNKEDTTHPRLNTVEMSRYFEMPSHVPGNVFFRFLNNFRRTNREYKKIVYKGRKESGRDNNNY